MVRNFSLSKGTHPLSTAWRSVPTASRIASASNDLMVKIWDAKKGFGNSSPSKDTQKMFTVWLSAPTVSLSQL